MPKMLLVCKFCGKETDMLPQLLSCLGWQKRSRGVLEPVWGEHIHHTIACNTEGCRGCWSLDLAQSEWVSLQEAAEAEREAEENPQNYDHIPGVIESRWVEANRASLMEEYEGQWIAVKGECVIAHAEDALTLRRCLEEAGAEKPFVARMVERSGTVTFL